jgi:hypothetical protein
MVMEEEAGGAPDSIAVKMSDVSSDEEGDGE